MVITGGLLLLMGILSALGTAAGAGATIYSAKKNAEAVRDTNAQNIAMQRETNAQAQYNMEHAHQIEMNDLQAAGLNPVLTATGGSGAPQAYLNAPQAKAPQIDLSGIGSAVSGATHMMSSMLMMKMMESNNDARNETLAAIANSKNAQSAANAALAWKAKNPYFDAKTQLLNKRLASGKAVAHSAKQIANTEPEFSDKEIDELLNFFKNR